MPMLDLFFLIPSLDEVNSPVASRDNRKYYVPNLSTWADFWGNLMYTISWKNVQDEIADEINGATPEEVINKAIEIYGKTTDLEKSIK